MNRLAAFTVILFSVFGNGCFDSGVHGSGRVKTETRNVSGFSNISLRGSGRVVIEQGGSESVTVTADDNLLNDIEAAVQGNTLVLGEKSGVRLVSFGDVVFKVTLRQLDSLESSGSGTVEAKGLRSPKMRVSLSGSGEISAEGAADDLDVTLSGSGQFHGTGLKSKRTSIDLTGSGNAEVASSETLNVTIRGSGSIMYVGDPRVNRTITGSGSIAKR